MHAHHMCWLCRTARKRHLNQKKADAAKATPKAMTPSAAYPYYETKPMQFRGVKIRAEPPVRAENTHPIIQSVAVTDTL